MYTITKADVAGSPTLSTRALAFGTALLATLSAASAAPFVYVSTTGSDSYDGLSATRTSGSHGPVASLARARAVALQLRAGDPASTITISIAPGNYYMTSTLNLLPGDSNMSYVASGSGVRLIGGLPVNTWRTVTTSSVLARLTPAARANVRVADLKTNAVKNYGSLLPRGWFTMQSNPSPIELYASGAPLRVATYPNSGWIPILSGTAGGQVTFASSYARKYSSTSGAMAYGYFKYDWADSTMPIQSYSGSTSMSIQTPPYGATAGGRFRIQNVLEELDQAGEYYVDRSKGLIYYWPSSPLNRDSVVASILETPIIKVQSTADVTFKGLTLESSRGRGLEISNSVDAMVDSVVVKGVGREGITLANCTGSTIQNSTVNDAGCSAIEVSGGNRFLLTASGNVVQNNTINRCSRIERCYRPGIMIQGVGNLIRSNTIKNVPHQAIQIYGNDHVIEYNLVDGACQETGDAGAIYSGREITYQGNVIRYNLIRNVQPTLTRAGASEEVTGIYLDDCASGFTVLGNIFDNVDQAITIGGGRDNAVTQNTFFRTKYDLCFDARGLTWGASMFSPGGVADQEIAALGSSLNLYRSRYPGFAAGLDEGYGTPKGNVLSTNILSTGSSVKYSDQAYTLTLLTTSGNLTGSATLLNNPSNGDYSLKNGVNAGFTPPSTSLIGALSVAN